MSNYFSYFPKISHDLKSDKKPILLQNILRRFKVASGVKDAVGVYHVYDVQAGDRPDTIAHKYYGSSKYAWVVLHFNNIENPVFDWPLFDPEFDDYIAGKYGSIATAQSNIHEYRWIYQQAEVTYDGISIPEKYYVVDETTYNTLSPDERKAVTDYDYEVELNEKKRKIKILDAFYLPQLENEVKTIIKAGL